MSNIKPTREKYKKQIGKIIVLHKRMPITASTLIASTVDLTGTYGAAQRRKAFEELGYPPKGYVYPSFPKPLAELARG